MRQQATQAVEAAAAVQARVESTFARIAATRMHGLPICHPGLGVEAVDFRPHAGDWLGALLTPWSLSLMIMPGHNGRFRPLAANAVQIWRFPSGDYDFIGNHEPALGDYQLCSLYSPMFGFADQAGARQAARLALAALFDPDLVDAVERNDHIDRPPRVTEAHGGPAEPSRRRFLRAFVP